MYQYLKVVGEVGNEIHNINTKYIVRYYTQDHAFDDYDVYDIVVVTTVDSVIVSFYDKDKRDEMSNKMSGLLDDKVITL